MEIVSRSNSLVKTVRSLASKKGRDKEGLHLVEGEKLVKEAVISSMVLVDGFIEGEHILYEAIIEGSGANLHHVNRSVMEALTNTVTPPRICATVKTPSLSMPDSFSPGLYIALDDIQDPGNLGTIIRTADAMGASGVFLSPACADPYSPKSIRAAMGSTYHLPIYQTNLNDALQKLKGEGFVLLCGHLQGEEVLPPLTDRCVIVIGNEGNGVAVENAALCALYRLPMQGRAESLNASIAAALVMHEVSKAMHGK